MRGYACVGLFNSKHSVNVGGAMRAAACYGASMVAITGSRFERHASDTTKAWRHTPLVRTESLRDAVPYGCVPVAVECGIDGAMTLPEYTHPDRAFYIFGPEDGSLGRGVTDWCRDIIYVPTRYCMNLAATVNVVLYDRMAKC